MNRQLEGLDVREGKTQDSYEVINRVIEESNVEIAKRHVTPREMRMDAALVKRTAKKYSDLLDGLVAGGAGSLTVEVEEFAGKMCNHMSWNSLHSWGNVDRTGVSRGDWVAFARTASAAFKSPMTSDGRPLYLQVHFLKMWKNGPSNFF